jgi:hypothetical protein
MKYIPDKFPYQEMQRETHEGSRHYVMPGNKLLPSVSTILSATKPLEAKKKLWEWRQRVGEKAAQEISTEAAGRGTRMHKYLENYIKTGDTGQPGSNPYSQQSHRMAECIISSGLSKCSEFWGTEISLYYPEVYAGTTDLVGVHDGKSCIMDHKQTNKPKKREYIDDYFLQLCAYATAHNQVYGTDIDRGVIFMCSADYQYQEFVIEGREFHDYTNRWFQRLEEYYRQFI